MEEKNKAEMMELQPIVFVVGREYQIMLYMAEHVLMWIEVGENRYYDEVNGILRSNNCVHRCIVPQEELNRAGMYTVCIRHVLDRKAYYSEIGEIFRQSFAFQPVSGERFRVYHIADTHGMLEEPVKAARMFGEVDFMVLNGDISSECNTMDSCKNLYELAWQTSQGRIPVVYVRGNHEMRGLYAENFMENIPTKEGLTYYTFRLGSIWGMVLDCGEDKDDERIEYGGVINCHGFRQRETAFIKSVIGNAETEYLEEGVTHKLVIVHAPFNEKYPPIFDIEDRLYEEWTELVGREIQPDVIMAGHRHKLRIDAPKGEYDYRGIGCPVVIGGICDYKSYYGGAGYDIGPEGIAVTFTDNNGECTEPVALDLL